MRSCFLTLALGLVFLAGAATTTGLARPGTPSLGLAPALVPAAAPVADGAGIVAGGPLATDTSPCDADAPEADGDQDPSGFDHEAPTAAPAATGPHIDAPRALPLSYRASGNEPAHAGAPRPALQPPRG